MKQLKRMLLLSILVMIVGIGAAFTLKVSIGVGAWDAVSQSIFYLSGIKVGTLGMMLNSACIVGQWVILRKDFHLRYLLQVPVTLLIGVVVNFILYDVLGAVVIDGYMMKLTLFLAALTVLSFAIAAMMVLDIVTFPLEAFCMALAGKTKWRFIAVRQSADISCILIAVLLTFGLSLPLTLREGTIIGMLLFAPLLGYFMKKVQPILQRFGLLDAEAEKIDADKNSIKAV
ncbi:YczE/YyaS/YitT family protein [Ectobacillus ponti]|uniref:YitT family protein n=1 Tax=Ectobacillus ponti TaxID=2961894 RepID=A0AA42BQ46_9BACI|nr:hypothetical protein [Ectobacillus ponti]MCP8969925.1 hypothetical protein [Ectobacillus ponti]